MRRAARVGHAIVSDVVQRADVGVIERRNRARLPLEALAEFRSRRGLSDDDFDGDDAIETRVAGLVDLAHAAFAELGDDAIGTEGCADHRGAR